MNTDRIKQLLERYYEGQTSKKEESEIESYFNENEIPEEMLTEKDMFLFYRNERTAEPDGINEIEGLVLQTIEKIELTEKGTSKGKVVLFRSISRSIFHAAAVALILVASFLSIDYLVPSNQLKDTFDNPEIAVMEAKKVFNLLANTINTGTENLSPMNTFSKAKEELSQTKALRTASEELNKVGEFGNGINELNKLLNINSNEEKK